MADIYKANAVLLIANDVTNQNLSSRGRFGLVCDTIRRGCM